MLLLARWNSETKQLFLEFHLLCMTNDLKLQPLIYGIFLCIYIVTILGNIVIFLAIHSDSHLHTPMYFFLSILSINDMCLSTSIIPKMWVNIQTQNNKISYIQCISQLCFVSVFSCMGNFLLAVMAYDHYVAICKPLMFTIIMNTSCSVPCSALSFV